jgi:uncharacterized protein (TIGR02246 family)
MNPTDLIRQEFDAWNKTDEDAYLAVYDDDATITNPGGEVFRGLCAIKRDFENLHNGLPDTQQTINTIFSAGDQACVEVTFEGTQTGTLALSDGRQIQPSGRYISLPFVGVYTISNDKIATVHNYFDQLDMFAQLGVDPPHRANETTP